MDVSAVDRPPGNLPADVTSFVGRRREIADVKSRLAGSRLVTLTGMGGVGKTRLGLRVAWEVRRGFLDGVWLVELAGLRDPDLLAHSLATSLGLREGSAGLSPGWLSDLLVNRQVLIVLDNCEHLLDPCAILTNELLRACPGVRILATSRQALGIDGEYVVEVPPFSIPEHGQHMSLKELARYEAVHLFVDRATAVRDGFQIDPANQAAVAAICRRLDGIPLAVELAASRLRGLSVDELMVRLDDRYALLTGGSRAAMPRQQTLRSLIDWSFDLCSGAERRLWARLSVFAGGFDLAAAEGVCSDDIGTGSDAVWDLVTHLVDKSIVVASVGVHGGRYELSETLREYGRDRLLELGNADAVRARHRDWCRELVTRAEADWFGAGQVTILTSLRREHANLRVALDFCLSTPDGTKIGLAMVSALRFYWNLSGRVKEGRHWLAQFLAAGGEEGQVELKAMCVSGYLATLDSDLTAADAVLARAGSLAARLHDSAGAALVTQIAGIVALFQNDPGRAESLFQDALDAHQRMGDEPSALYDQVQLALTAALLGESDRASVLLDECLGSTRSQGDHWLRAMSLWALGIERCKQGDFLQAEAFELESLRLRAAMDDRWSIGLNLQVLGWVAAATGDARRAARLLGASEAVAHSVGLSPAALGHLNAIQQSYEGIGRRELTDAGFDRAYEGGRQLTFDDAVGLALGQALPMSGQGAGTTTARPPGYRLTKRENEVAELISRGMSNKEIAAALVISQRTAEAHVEHILTKLGLSSRTQVAVWVSRERDDQSD